MAILYLVGGLEHDFYDFSYIGNVIIPTDDLIFFRGVAKNHQYFVFLDGVFTIYFFDDNSMQFPIPQLALDFLNHL
jgi:hypothetical protein